MSQVNNTDFSEFQKDLTQYIENYLEKHLKVKYFKLNVSNILN
jgi:hypothetical protein